MPVTFRSNSNALPVPVGISLQSALKNFAPAQRDAVLRTKLRDLQLAEFRLAPPFNLLAAGYRSVLANYLDGRKPALRPAPASGLPVTTHRSLSVAQTIERLDALDANRRAVEAKLDLLPRTLNSVAP